MKLTPRMGSFIYYVETRARLIAERRKVQVENCSTILASQAKGKVA